jgi:hypothetical protein
MVRFFLCIRRSEVWVSTWKLVRLKFVMFLLITTKPHMFGTHAVGFYIISMKLSMQHDELCFEPASCWSLSVLFNPEDASVVLFRNVGWLSPDYTAQNLRKRNVICVPLHHSISSSGRNLYWPKFRLYSAKEKKAIPVSGRGGLKGCEIPHCVDSRLTDVGKVVSPTHRTLSTPQKHFSTFNTRFF